MSIKTAASTYLQCQYIQVFTKSKISSYKQSINVCVWDACFKFLLLGSFVNRDMWEVLMGKFDGGFGT